MYSAEVFRGALEGHKRTEEAAAPPGDGDGDGNVNRTREWNAFASAVHETRLASLASYSTRGAARRIVLFG